MNRRQKEKNGLSAVTLALCLISAAAISVSAFLAVSNHNNIKKEKEVVKLIKEADVKNRDMNEQVTALSGELEEKKSYIDEWSSVYQQLSENSTSSSETSADPDSTDDSAQDSQYASLYPDLNVDKKDNKINTSGKKIVHLTFDDGPSEKTGEVLDLLDQYGIKATFFVTYTDNEELQKYYKEIVDRGHTIAVHTASHDYKKIYSSVEAYLEDFDKIYQMIYTETGVRTTIFRYPGGSLNLKQYAAGEAIKKEMERRGFIYYDWNVSSGDGGKHATEDSILQWVTAGVGKYHESVVLMHDTRTPTVAILPEVLKQLTQMDCVFEPLDSNTKKVQFYDQNY